MAVGASIVVALKTLFIVLFCVMVAAYVYLFIFGDYMSCFDMHARWQMLVAADFTAYVVAIGAWVAYKESSWIIAAVLMVAMYFLGSHLPIGYMLLQFYKLSYEESLKDPLYFVLARRKKRDLSEGTSVAAARVVFLILGCMVVGVLSYTLIADLSPSYTKYFSSCIITNEVDIYIHVVIFSVWIAYKEPSWVKAFLWIVLLVCFRGVAVCAYVVQQLFYLSPQQPAFLIIFKNNRDLQTNDDPMLMGHPNDV